MCRPTEGPAALTAERMPQERLGLGCRPSFAAVSHGALAATQVEPYFGGVTMAPVFGVFSPDL